MAAKRGPGNFDKGLMNKGSNEQRVNSVNERTEDIESYKDKKIRGKGGK